MIRIGIIGCGKIAQVRHLPEYAANPHVELAGYYDLNTQRAQEMRPNTAARSTNPILICSTTPASTPCPSAWKTAAMRRSPPTPCMPGSTFCAKSPWP